jgi:hypothetical protein
MVDVRTHASAAVLLEQMEEAGPGRSRRRRRGGRPAGRRQARIMSAAGSGLCCQLIQVSHVRQGVGDCTRGLVLACLPDTLCANLVRTLRPVLLARRRLEISAAPAIGTMY